MPQCPDLPPLDALVQTQTVTFDFGPLLLNNYPPNTTLTGTPAVTCALSSGVDGNPSSRRLGSPAIGTAPLPKGSGVTNGAVLQQLGTLQPKCVYVLIATCGITGSTDMLSLWARAPIKTPN